MEFTSDFAPSSDVPADGITLTPSSREHLQFLQHVPQLSTIADTQETFRVELTKTLHRTSHDNYLSLSGKNCYST